MFDKKMIEELSNAFGPSGFEDDVIDVIRIYAGKIGTFYEDSLRNLYLYRKENTGDKPVLMLDAHTDEVGLIVQSIKSNGLIRTIPLGSWNDHALPASIVRIRNSSGKQITGIVPTKPGHFANTTVDFNREKDVFFVDIGATSKYEVSEIWGIHVGDPVAPVGRFEFDDENGIMFGKAFDCRIGCAALIETLFRLENIVLPFDVVGVFSAQEEVGDRGCKVAVNRVKPSIAICFEGAPADDTIIEGDSTQCALKCGPMIRYADRSLICSPRFLKFILEISNVHNLPIQCAVRGKGGNNGAVINTALAGIPVSVVSIPVRYTHSPNCIASYVDFENTVQLVTETIKALSQEILSTF